MIDEDTIEQEGGVFGFIGPFIDHRPRITTARVRPFLWGPLLWLCAIRRDELIAMIVPLANQADVRIDPDDAFERTFVEVAIDQALGELVAEQKLRYREDGLYVLTLAAKLASIQIVCSTNAQLPDHLIGSPL
jgi:hypothetical protein